MMSKMTHSPSRLIQSVLSEQALRPVFGVVYEASY